MCTPDLGLGIEIDFPNPKALDNFHVTLKPEYGLYYRATLKFHVVVPTGNPHFVLIDESSVQPSVSVLSLSVSISVLGF